MRRLVLTLLTAALVGIGAAIATSGTAEAIAVPCFTNAGEIIPCPAPAPVPTPTPTPTATP
jgi:hypothetical protein